MRSAVKKLSAKDLKAYNYDDDYAEPFIPPVRKDPSVKMTNILKI